MSDRCRVRRANGCLKDDAKRTKRTNGVAGSAPAAGRMCPTLPDDVIFVEILPRLGAADMRRARGTCKSWKEFLDGQVMRRMYLHKRFTEHLEALSLSLA
eukprot:TRINITY_DN12132_c0_g1_i1.p2 TRINITY_DN12132_c0_g1~~TRINITY_DN12132_c0_g1_i1.p2  ORF type:complete len:100 (-),score=10.57 TRINITY_DN12132_c0_g1_i1:825-1124(-)